MPLLVIIFFYADAVSLSVIINIYEFWIKHKKPKKHILRMASKGTKVLIYKIFAFYIIITEIFFYLYLYVSGYHEFYFTLGVRIIPLIISYASSIKLQNEFSKQINLHINRVTQLINSPVLIYLIKSDAESLKDKTTFIINTELAKSKNYLSDLKMQFLKSKFEENISNFEVETFDFNIIASDPYIGKLKNIEDRTAFLILLFRLVTIDDKYTKNEDEVLRHVGRHLQLNKRWFERYKNRYVKSEEDFTKEYTHYQQYFNNVVNTSNEEKLKQAFDILGLPVSASEPEIKNAYRSLVKQNHPDKVAYLGEAYVEKANAVFVKIQQAYDYISREKNLR